MIIINNLDIQITNFINLLIPHYVFFNYFFSFFSQAGYSIFIWIVILALLFIFEEKRDHKFIVYFLLAFLTSMILSTTIKDIVKRPRPCQSNLTIKQSNNYPCPSDSSFPSGHATTAFAAAVIFSKFDKKRRWFYYLIATLIGLSRIYLGVHYFFDVLLGAVSGIIFAKLILSTHHIKHSPVHPHPARKI